MKVKEYIDRSTGEIVCGQIRTLRQLEVSSAYYDRGVVEYRVNSDGFVKVYNGLIELLPSIRGSIDTFCYLVGTIKNSENKCKVARNKAVDSKIIAEGLRGKSIRKVQMDLAILKEKNIIIKRDGYIYMNPKYVQRTAKVKEKIYKMFEEGVEEDVDYHGRVINRDEESGYKDADRTD